jgi:L-ascorbate metabolism protein UlaG (beta-lactamase superfamily)
LPSRSYPLSDHYDGKHFSNANGEEAGQSFARVPRMLLERRESWPNHVDVIPQKPAPLGDAGAVITFIGHSTFLIQTAAGNVITDPVYSTHAGPFGRLGPKRVREPAVRFDDLPPISAILLSHCHYDHCDLPTLARLIERDDPVIVAPLGNERIVAKAGATRVVEIDWWETEHTTPFGVTGTPARHFAARSPFDKNTSLWSGFVFKAGGKRLYFAGDTACADFFGEIPRRFGRIDLAFIPVGAYEPQWFMKVVHMNPTEAIRAFQELGSPPSIAMHFGTFQLTAEAIDEPTRRLRAECEKLGIPESAFGPLGFGESLAIR